MIEFLLKEVDSRSMFIRLAYHAPQITMPSYAKSIIISSLAKVKKRGERWFGKAVSKFQIINHGDWYTALIIREIASMPKRANSLIACDLWREIKESYKVELCKKALR